MRLAFQPALTCIKDQPARHRRPSQKEDNVVRASIDL